MDFTAFPILYIGPIMPTSIAQSEHRTGATAVKRAFYIQKSKKKSLLEPNTGHVVNKICTDTQRTLNILQWQQQS